MIVALLLACSREPAPLAEAAPVWIEARHVEADHPVRLHAPVGTALPDIEGITAEQVSTGDDGSAVWELRGASGSYYADVPDPGGTLVRVFFDIGVDGPTGGPMEDLASLPAPAPPLWPRVLAGALTLAAFAGVGVLAWNKLKPTPPPPIPEPPDRVARRAWAALRARTDLEPDRLAVELSAVYRRYLEAVHDWPATSRTSREILDALAGELPATQLERSRRLLYAMDIVRFSERSTQVGFLAALDDDFDALVGPAVHRA